MRVGVIGGGLMGSGIAEVCARSGVDVTVVEVDDARAEQTRAKIDKSLDRAARSGKLEEDDRAAAGERLAYTTRVEDLEGADAAIEAVIEDEQTKRELFLKLDEILPDAEFLASNTSSVPIMKLAADTSQPDRVLGMHFFNPVPVLPLVEIVRSIMTSEQTSTARTVRRGHARQDDDRLAGPRRLRRQRAAHPLHPQRRPHVRVGLRRQGGHRPRHGQGLRAPDGPARARRPDRARHAARRLAVALRGVPRPRLGRPRAAQPHGRGGPARPQDRPRLLRLLELEPLNGV